MNEEFFTGFDKNYIFFDDDNNMMLSFNSGVVLEASVGDDIYFGKWRFSKPKQLVEIFLPELEFKIIYKMKVAKENKEKDETFISAKYVIKYEGSDKDDKKGETLIVKTVNNLEYSTESNISKVEKIIIFSVFIGLFLILLLLSLLIPAVGEMGIIYVSAIILTLQILLINKIKKIVLKFVKKNEERINSLFYGK